VLAAGREPNPAFLPVVPLEPLAYSREYAAAMAGSSPDVSWPRPQRGSRKMLMLGAQYVSPAWPVLCMPRASVVTAPATARHSEQLKAAVERMTCGKAGAAWTGPRRS